MGFRKIVIDVVCSIPKGKVATYGQIASMAGNSRASRQVGFALRSLGLEEAKVPWWRVVNKQGFISINLGDGGMEKLIQKDLLQSEGVEFTDELTVAMPQYLWIPAGII